MKELPEFQHRSSETVAAFLTQALSHPNAPEKTYFRRLIPFEDGHFRVVFSLAYLGNVETPSKSQWNNLKKKLKRHDKRIFIFKDHGVAPCEQPDERCGYIDFGYFAH
ncbi:MAG: hypothetical protein IT319_15365 [Anaerolineae bacterium]|nr:hypothetical protein [Anaerolineae bacterium]